MEARVSVRGVELAHEQLGSGEPPLIWGHGLTSSRASEDDFPLVDLRALSEERRVVRYDARGHGASGLTEDVSDYGWERMAADQLALADVLGIDRYVAGGASLGAATALYAAVTAPERVAALLLVIPPTAWDTRAAQRELYEAMADAVEHRGVELLVQGAAQMPPPDPFAGDDRWYEAGARRLRSADPHRLATVLQGAATADLPPREQIAAIEVPTLVLAWSGDTGHPVSTARALEELIPGARLHLASTGTELARWTDEARRFLAAV